MWSTFAQTAKSFADDFSMLVSDEADGDAGGEAPQPPAESEAERPQPGNETVKPRAPEKSPRPLKEGPNKASSGGGGENSSTHGNWALEKAGGRPETPHKRAPISRDKPNALSSPKGPRSKGASQDASKQQQDARGRGDSSSRKPVVNKFEPSSTDLESMLGSREEAPVTRQTSFGDRHRDGKAARPIRSRTERETKPSEKANIVSRRPQPPAEPKPSPRKLPPRSGEAAPSQRGSSTNNSAPKTAQSATEATTASGARDANDKASQPKGAAAAAAAAAAEEGEEEIAKRVSVITQQQAEDNLRLQHEISDLKKELESSKASNTAAMDKQVESNTRLQREIEDLRKELDSNAQDYRKKADEASKLKSSLREREQSIRALEFKCEELTDAHNAEVERMASSEKKNAKQMAKRLGGLKDVVAAQKSLESSLSSAEESLNDLENLLTHTIAQLPLSMERRLAQSFRDLLSQYGDEISIPAGRRPAPPPLEDEACVQDGAPRPEGFVVVGQAVDQSHDMSADAAKLAAKEEARAAELERQKEEVARLSQAHEQLLSELASARKQLKDKESHAASLQSQLQDKLEAEARQRELESELKSLQDKTKAQGRANERLESELQSIMRKSEEERRELEDSDNLLEKEKAKARSLSVQVSSLSQKVSLLEKEVVDLESARDKALGALATSEEENKMVIEAAREAEEDLLDEREKASQLEDELKEHIASLEARLEESEGQKDSAESEMREQITGMEEQLKELDALKDTIRSLEGEKESALAEVQGMEAEVGRMKAELVEKESLQENGRAEADEVIQDLRNQLRLASSKAEQAEDAYQELAAKSEEKNRRFAYIQKESVTREAELRQSVADVEIMVSSLTAEKQELHSSLQAAAKSEAKHKERCDEVEREARSAEARFNDQLLALKNGHAQEVNALKSSARRELEEQVSSTTREMQSAQDEIQHRLEARIKEAAGRAEQAEAAEAKAREELGELKGRATTAASSLEELSVKRAAVEAEREKWKSAASEAESRAQALASEKRSLEAKLRQVNDAALSLVEENTRLSEASKPYEEVEKEMAQKVGAATAKIRDLEEQVAQWKESCESMQADRRDMVLKSAVDDERTSLLRRVEELDTSLFDAQSLSEKLERELEEARERMSLSSQDGLPADEQQQDLPKPAVSLEAFRTRIPKADLQKQQQEFEEKKLDKLRSNGLRMARLIKKWSKGRAKVEYEKQVYDILGDGDSSAYPTISERIRALDSICVEMQKELKVWFKR